MLFTKHSQKQEIIWSDKSFPVFEKIKFDLSTTTMLNHPVPNATTRIMTDASFEGVGSVLQQQLRQHRQPLSFF